MVGEVEIFNATILIVDDLEANDIEAIRDRVEEINELSEWLTLDGFDRRRVNRRLKQYATHDEAWMWP